MLQIIGVFMLFTMVLGGFLLSGGSLKAIMDALPHELMTIGGAAFAALLIGGSAYSLRKLAGDLGKLISGPQWKPSDYRDLLCLLFLLIKLIKARGAMGIEVHIERPAESAIFNRYPRIAKDRVAMALICDTLRTIAMNLEDAQQVEDLIENQIERLYGDLCGSATALQNMADGLPALGIVAAVLGVIETMGLITESPEVLGRMIGSALVGTFTGVFLAYGIVAPMGTRLQAIVDEDILFYHIIRDVVVAHLRGDATQVSIEIGRASVPSEAQPSFQELEAELAAIPVERG